MFTPPPSPHPLSRSDQLLTHNDAMLEPQFPKSFSPSSHESKRKIGRRTGWAVLLVPLAVILITAYTRLFTHPTAFDVFSSPPSWDTLVSKGQNWTPHKRHPLPEPQLVSSTMSSATSSTTAAAQPSIPTIPSSPPALPTPFPQPFDSYMTQNFSSVSCSDFFTNMTNTLDFRSCRPFSLLLSSSAAFINAQRNLTLMNTLLWGTCNTDTPNAQCVANMGWFATSLRTECTQELSTQNPMVQQTLTGLEAFEVMFNASCLADPTTNAFCFLNAVDNPDPTELYFYELPLGIALPVNANPQCTPCTKSVLNAYAAALSDPTQADSLAGLKQTYDTAAGLTIKSCGSTYATTVTNGMAALRPNSLASVMGMMLLLGYALLLSP